MTHAKHPLTQKVRKQLAKEIKKGEKEPSSTETAATVSLDQKKSLIAKLSSKKEEKKRHSISKRTTPSEIDTHESPPASLHGETPRIQKAAALQTRIRGKILEKKEQKRKNAPPLQSKKNSSSGRNKGK